MNCTIISHNSFALINHLIKNVLGSHNLIILLLKLRYLIFQGLHLIHFAFKLLIFLKFIVDIILFDEGFLLCRCNLFLCPSPFRSHLHQMSTFSFGNYIEISIVNQICNLLLTYVEFLIASAIAGSISA